MKNLLIICALLTSLNSFSTSCVMCTSDGMYVYTSNENISLNEMIILEGYANSQKTINSLSKRNVFLISKSDKVLLIHKGSFVGGFRLTQALFVPSRLLKPNTTYFLEFENQTKEETQLLKIWNRKKKTHEKISFRTSSNKTTENKYPKTKFKFKNSNHTMFGCGPAIYANFTILNPIKKKSIYKIELYDLTTNKITTYYQSNLQNEISIGHGMCSGAFNFIAGNKYKVRFTPMNSSGKLKKPSDWITFKNPYKDIKNQW